jgi:hypothetical protein
MTASPMPTAVTSSPTSVRFVIIFASEGRDVPTPTQYCAVRRRHYDLDMKQVAHRPRDGRITLVGAPVPTPRVGWILVENCCPSISPGTERSKLDLGGKNLVQRTVVENRASIGSGAVVLGGVRIGEGALVGRARFVTRDVAPDETVAGISARAASGRAAP